MGHWDWISRVGNWVIGDYLQRFCNCLAEVVLKHRWRALRKWHCDYHVVQMIDFEPILLGPLFGQLRDLECFRQVKLDPDLGTLVWPNGADIAPNVLHEWPNQVDAIAERRRQQFAVTV